MNEKQREIINSGFENSVKKDGISYMEAICEFMERKKIDPETMAEILSPRIRDILRVEGYKLNLLGKRTRKITTVLKEDEDNDS